MISLALVGVLSACFLVGAVPALVNALKPRLQESLQLDSQRVERMERMQFFLAWVAGMPLAGILVDAWRPHAVVVLGCLGIAVALSLFGIAQSPRWIGAMSFLLGVATSLLAVATLTLAPEAIPLVPARAKPCPAAALNLAFIAIALGSFSPHFTLTHLERWLGLRNGLLIMGLGALLPAGLVYASMVPESSAASNLPTPSVNFFHDLRFWLIAGMMLLYFPIESALDIWSGPFLREIGYEKRSGRFMLVGFWIAFLGARLAMWYLLSQRDEIWLLFLCIVTSAVILGNLVGAYGQSSGGIGYWLVGACYGPLLPTLLGLLLEYFPATRGVALGIVLAAAGLHDALAQPVMVRAAQNRSVRIAMRVPLLMTLLMLAPLIVIGLVQPR